MTQHLLTQCVVEIVAGMDMDDVRDVERAVQKRRREKEEVVFCTFRRWLTKRFDWLPEVSDVEWRFSHLLRETVLWITLVEPVDGKSLSIGLPREVEIVIVILGVDTELMHTSLGFSSRFPTIPRELWELNLEHGREIHEKLDEIEKEHKIVPWPGR